MGWQDDPVAGAPAAQSRPRWAQDPVDTDAPPPVRPPANEAPEQPNTWGQAVKNVGQAGAHFGSGMLAGIGGDIVGLQSIIPSMIAKKFGYDINPTDIQNKVASAFTYQPKNSDTLSMKIADFPGKVVGAAGDKLEQAVDGVPVLQMLPVQGLPAAGLNALGLKGARIAGRAPKALPEAVPTTLELKSASNAAYKAADDAGVVIAPHSTAKVVGMMDEVAKAENLGKLPPKLAEASKVLQERIAANEPLTLKDADKVRQLINDAKASTDASDRRLAKIVQTKYDNYLNSLKPEDTLAGDAATATAALKDARELYKRQKNSELVDSIEKRASNTGEANYTQAGSEAALRREFLRIVNNERKARMFTPDQQAAMMKVAAPGAAANTLRNLGKMDPLKGGVPAAIATTIGGGLGSIAGPVGSIGGAAAIGTIGHLASRGAQAITRSNVLKAREALVGRGLPSQVRNAAAGARNVPDVLKDIRQLDADLARLPKSEPFDSPRRKALEQKAKTLQAELLIVGTSAASQR